MNITFKKYLLEMTNPLDPEQFIYLSRIYILAFMGDIPAKLKDGSLLSDNPPPSDEPYLRLTDRGENRGAIAVIGECHELKLTKSQTSAMLNRIMLIPYAIQKMKNSPWIKMSKDGSTLVADALIRACAVCKFKTRGDRQLFDCRDLVAQAKAFDEIEQKQKQQVAG